MEHMGFTEQMDDRQPRKRNRVRELRENKLMTQKHTGFWVAMDT